ncbi:putative protein TPRXL [Homarus americanus]|uniref:putative protein TPRXL n=1 Tax=Homarus americanus TaxID=6706 RepID=UPI001C43EF95|nr:putative protein TPRXL [Homarus americanus]
MAGDSLTIKHTVNRETVGTQGSNDEEQRDTTRLMLNGTRQTRRARREGRRNSLSRQETRLERERETKADRELETETQRRPQLHLFLPTGLNFSSSSRTASTSAPPPQRPQLHLFLPTGLNFSSSSRTASTSAPPPQRPQLHLFLPTGLNFSSSSSPVAPTSALPPQWPHSSFPPAASANFSFFLPAASISSSSSQRPQLQLFSPAVSTSALPPQCASTSALPHQRPQLQLLPPQRPQLQLFLTSGLNFSSSSPAASTSAPSSPAASTSALPHQRPQLQLFLYFLASFKASAIGQKEASLSTVNQTLNPHYNKTPSYQVPAGPHPKDPSNK